MNAAQASAFQANSGLTPSGVSTVLLCTVFATLLLWSAWALRGAYSGWAEAQLSQRQLTGVMVRIMALYLVLTFFLLS
ncbi:TIGR03758 family integrating conjugative element protein [Pseudomonas sp. 273]|uniref:TIGR03758 family integrating conjugative element protein n=1 Tax=Pseudomonas sp. 273 TaxID=75692 RepID=UPI0023D8293D|nr:TIGR03758 family integrating conjugative element protein [Pseudomonas sp. 273]